jgi:hypothetical protein
MISPAPARNRNGHVLGVPGCYWARRESITPQQVQQGPALALFRCQVQLIRPWTVGCSDAAANGGTPNPRPANLSKPGRLIWACLSPPAAACAQSRASLAADDRSTLRRAQAVAAPASAMTKVLAGCSPAFTAKLAGGRRTIKLTRRSAGPGEWACETRGRLRNDASAGGNRFCRHERLVCALDRCLMDRLINYGVSGGRGLAVIMGWRAHIGLFTVAPLSPPPPMAVVRKWKSGRRVYWPHLRRH